MLQSISSVFIVYRRKTLTGSPDPTHANGTDKPCTAFTENFMGLQYSVKLQGDVENIKLLLVFIKKTFKNCVRLKKPNHVRDALRSVQSDVFHCRENIHFLLSFDLLSNIEGNTEQSTSFGTVPEITEIVKKRAFIGIHRDQENI